MYVSATDAFSELSQKSMTELSAKAVNDFFPKDARTKLNSPIMEQKNERNLQIKM